MIFHVTVPVIALVEAETEAEALDKVRKHVEHVSDHLSVYDEGELHVFESEPIDFEPLRNPYRKGT